MAKKDYWKTFEETGNINAYLSYRAEMSRELDPMGTMAPGRTDKKGKKVSGDDGKPKGART